MATAASATPAANTVVKALATGKINPGWIDTTTFFAAITDSTFSVVGNLDASKKFAVQADTQNTGIVTTLDVGAQTAAFSIVLPILTATRTLRVTGQAQDCIGFVDGSTAAATQIGEEIKSTVAAVAVAATGTVGNVTSISLTAGDWLVSGYAVFDGGATGLTAGTPAKMSIVTTSATNGVAGDTMTQESILALLASGLFALDLPAKRVRLAAPTTYYLTEQVSYAAGSPTVSGTITATRVR